MTLETLAEKWATCAMCDLADSRNRVVYGRTIGGDDGPRILVVGEAPGEQEDAQGEPFVGPSGDMLAEEFLTPAGIDRAYLANLVCCWPGPGNRDPRPEEIRACSGRLQEQIQEVAPDAVVAVGRLAKQHVGALVAGLVDLERVPFVAIPHPAWFLRQGHPNATTRGKLVPEVAKLRRLMSRLRPSTATGCKHDPVVAGTIGRYGEEEPLQICRLCYRRVA